MAYDCLFYDVQDSLALLTINRPSRRNAISRLALDEMRDGIERADRDEKVRALAITGVGDTFSTGFDLNEVRTRDAAEAITPIVQGIANLLESLRKPTIAAINGDCMGGGLEVALGCDLRIGSSTAKFAMPEAKLGIIPGGGGTQRLPRTIGRSWAVEMLLMGRTLNAQEALKVGLVTRVVEPSELLPELVSVVSRFNGHGPLVPHAMKKALNAGETHGFEFGLMVEKFQQAGLLGTEDAREGISAFLEKRSPKFKGQ